MFLLFKLKVFDQGHERRRGDSDTEAYFVRAVQGLQRTRTLHAAIWGLHHRCGGRHRGNAQISKYNIYFDWLMPSHSFLIAADQRMKVSLKGRTTRTLQRCCRASHPPFQHSVIPTTPACQKTAASLHHQTPGWRDLCWPWSTPLSFSWKKIGMKSSDQVSGMEKTSANCFFPDQINWYCWF